jgi:LytS/YehU family sensor histidine kinase
MPKHFVIVLLLLACNLQAQSQVDYKQKIDDLRKQLFFLRDSAKVDCLNNLSETFILLENKDSAEHSADLAYSEAQKINYIHGIAISFCRKAQITKQFDNDFIQSELLGRESLRWFQKTSNKSGIDTLYHNLAFAVLAQSKFDEALYYIEKKFDWAKKTGDQPGMFETLISLSGINRQSGNYEKAFVFAQRAYEFALKEKNKFWISRALYFLAQLHMVIEDYPNALSYFRKIFQLDDSETIKNRINSDYDIWFKMEYAEVFSHLNQFDSAWYYYNLFKPSKNKEVYLRVYSISTGECYYLQKDYQHALQNFQFGLAGHKKLNDRNEIMRTLLDIGKTHLALKNNLEALKYSREGLNIAVQTKAKRFMRDGYQILSTVYDRLHQTDSANFYFRQYITMKDDVLNDQTKAKFVAYNYEQQIALINKEKQINQQQLKIKQQQLQRESLQKKILIAGVIILFLLSGFIVRSIMLKRRNEKQYLKHEIEIQKLESEKTKTGLQKQAAELEMQALRAQMNPHFIFNSLNSINMFILENNKLQASEYLSKFSRLVRLILQNSQEAFIPLESELESLQLYLELESLRFENRFEYRISVDDDVDTTVLKVPPLIIQPYAENAIWHGLMNKEEKGHLEIELSQQDEILCCLITDDGIGRKKAAELASKSATRHKSMGLKITADRIAMLQRLNGNESPITINDLVNADGSAAGTEVAIKMPVVY